MSPFVKSFAVQNLVITPVPVLPHAPVTSIHYKSLLVLTGVCVIDLQGNNPNDWRRETILIQPDLDTPLQHALESQGSISVASSYNFQVDQGAPFAAISSVFEKEAGAVDAGFAVDAWRLSLGSNKVFTGLEVDVAVRNNRATLYRISYHLTLLGTIHSKPLPNHP